MSIRQLNKDGERLFHWYSFTFLGNRPDGSLVHSQKYRGFRAKKITPRLVGDVAKELNLHQNSAVLLSLAYLGHMSEKEFWE